MFARLAQETRALLVHSEWTASSSPTTRTTVSVSSATVSKGGEPLEAHRSSGRTCWDLCFYEGLDKMLLHFYYSISLHHPSARLDACPWHSFFFSSAFGSPFLSSTPLLCTEDTRERYRSPCAKVTFALLCNSPPQCSTPSPSTHGSLVYVSKWLAPPRSLRTSRCPNLTPPSTLPDREKCTSTRGPSGASVVACGANLTQCFGSAHLQG